MKITIIATGFEKKPGDATRAGVTVKTNPGSPFKREIPVGAAPAPVQGRPAPQRPATAAEPVRRPMPKPAPKPVADDDFDDLLDMMKR
jgi:hypothetical protein